MKIHAQVKLQHGRTFQTVWIPEKYARIGRKITIQDDPTIWEVIDVYAFGPTEEITARSQDFRHQRKVSDI